ncbi:hypothetical protein GOBAR_AA39488 [Gossypium barbadense]|uniref:30S ribosomal protein S11, chloroplastic n=1 Tax=Gossypium barbadense TaxID=3634 RepID=A0A2P5VQU7_GOSBA|nr:hypothetical protein GOBAR_AA39488 [Gossypium barbadense]
MPRSSPSSSKELIKLLEGPITQAQAKLFKEAVLALVTKIYAGNAIRAVVDQGMQRAEVMIKGPGLGRDAALRAIRRSGILLSFVRDVTPMPHNGCRPPKKRRV